MELKYHTPVMLSEAIDYLDLKPAKTIVDATVGTGGHATAILERITRSGRLICIDRDEESLAIARSRLKEFCGSCEFVHGNFMDLDKILPKLNVKKIDGILFDLGLSSFQLENPDRGFSFQNEGPLDMRLDRDSYISAYDLLNNLNQEELSSLLKAFGQERWHNRIAHRLVEERDRHPISTTLQLSEIVLKAVPYKYRYYRIHPATRTFQAVRIAVNRELESLEIAVEKALGLDPAFTGIRQVYPLGLLNKGARICVISFHSLEDRIVKFSFRKAQAMGLIKIITPKPLTPTLLEIKDNPSSRSAKLRVAQKL